MVCVLTILWHKNISHAFLSFCFSAFLFISSLFVFSFQQHLLSQHPSFLYVQFEKVFGSVETFSLRSKTPSPTSLFPKERNSDFIVESCVVLFWLLDVWSWSWSPQLCIKCFPCTKSPDTNKELHSLLSTPPQPHSSNTCTCWLLQVYKSSLANRVYSKAYRAKEKELNKSGKRLSTEAFKALILAELYSSGEKGFTVGKLFPWTPVIIPTYIRPLPMPTPTHILVSRHCASLRLALALPHWVVCLPTAKEDPGKTRAPPIFSLSNTTTLSIPGKPPHTCDCPLKWCIERQGKGN